MIWPWSTTTISSASSSASSRYCVVRSSVLPSRTWLRMTSHIASRLRGSSPVVGSSRNRSLGCPIERRGEVEAAAHAAGVRLRDPVGGVLEREPLEELVRPAGDASARRQLVEPAEHPEVLAAGEVLVDRGVLPREADQLADRLRVARDVEPGDASPGRRRPGAASRGSGRSSSCPRRSARAGRAPCPRAPRGRRRRARGPRSSATGRP